MQKSANAKFIDVKGMDSECAEVKPDFRAGDRVLAIEGGGTKTEWILAQVQEGGWEIKGRGLLPASNLKLASDAQLSALFAALPGDVETVSVFLAGCGTEADRVRLGGLVGVRWPGARAVLGSDRESALAAAFGDGDGVVVIAGTGAAVHGRCEGRLEKAGGWGQLLGDRGSGYHLAMQGLRCVLSSYDLHGTVSPAAQTFLRTLGLNRLHELVDWVSAADKMAVAKLAPVVFEAARAGDVEMLRILREGARILAEYTEAVMARLERGNLPVRLFGGIFEHHLEYEEYFAEHLALRLPGAHVELCTVSGATGALWLATRPEVSTTLKIVGPAHGDAATVDAAELAMAETEQRNSRSSQMDQLGTREMVRLFISEEEEVQRALAAEEANLERAVDVVAAALLAGGRLFYVGAGTSGRLGVLDASEIPPTFGVAPELVQGIIAGGASALHRAVEGAEDYAEAGGWAVAERGVHGGDVVCGIAASGRTPFVLGALAHARKAGAGTILLTCNPSRRRAKPPWDVEIDLPTGPELVTGSTRLKAGTASKLVLNILTTCAMVRMGKVRGNLMVNVRGTNDKLRLRAQRLVCEILSISLEEAVRLLELENWEVARVLARPKSA